MDVHVDLVGPLPPSDGKIYILTMIDRFTRWPEATPIPDASAATCAQPFFSTWVARFGCPATIVSDRDRQFVGTLWHSLGSLLGTSMKSSTAYHPCSNGIVERFHRHMKSALKARLNGDTKWSQHLPAVLLGIRSAIKEDIGHSASDMVYGAPLRLPGAFFSSKCSDPHPDTYVTELRQAIANRSFVPSSWHSKQLSKPDRIVKGLDSCTHVWEVVSSVKKPLDRPYRGPYKVLRREKKYFIIDRSGKEESVSLERLKPAFGVSDTIVDESVPTTTQSGRFSKPPAFFQA